MGDDNDDYARVFVLPLYLIMRGQKGEIGMIRHGKSSPKVFVVAK